MKAMLVDTTRCTGCRSCQVACKQWNNLPAVQTRFFSDGSMQNPAHRSSKTWAVVTFHELPKNNRPGLFFGRLQCFHCVDPACADACPVHALKKTKLGPVVYDPGLCLGCRYCQMACPFNAPRFDWDKPVPEIRKCTMCYDRVAAGGRPACVAACPAEALAFGERSEMVAEAEARIRQSPARYVAHVYGKNEVGGTCVLHLAAVPFESLGYPSGLPDEPVADHIRSAMHTVPYAMATLGLALGAVAWVVNRRMENTGDKPDKAE
ncbi:MAG: 4Fe-4S dicluster domain-containing protein [Thermodesulfobacteriota bacterium]